ncbi:MAG: hypothetical protein ACOX2K_06755 [Bacillota bacterium]|jgi:hypothetical protein
MRQWQQKHIKRYMYVPIIQKTVSYLLIAVAVVLLWNRFVNRGLLPISYAFTVGGVLFLASAWVSYLRLDGVKVPLLTLFRLRRKKPVVRSFSDMSDHIDEDIVSFEELIEEERHACCLLANLLCSIVFFALSLT